MDQDKNIKPKIVQTYAADMAKVLSNDTGGLVKKIIHGAEEKEAEKINSAPESKKNKLYVFLSVVFVCLSLSILMFFLLKKDAVVVPVEKTLPPIIFNDKNIFIEVKDFDQNQISQSVANEVTKTDVKVGGVEGIFLTYNKKVVGLRQFIQLIKSNLVPIDTQLLQDSFLIGAVNTNSKDLFLLLKVRTLPDIFDSLRAWEKKMFTDMHSYFGVNISETNRYLLTKDFEDGVIENKNARILYDEDHKIVLMYIFADDNSVLITNTLPAAHEVMARIAASKVEK